MNRNERIMHNIGIFVVGIFLGVALCVTVYLGFFAAEREPTQERENIRITERESAWTTNVKAW